VQIDGNDRSLRQRSDLTACPLDVARACMSPMPGGAHRCSQVHAKRVLSLRPGQREDRCIQLRHGADGADHGQVLARRGRHGHHRRRLDSGACLRAALCVTCVQCVVWVSGCLRVWVRLPHACLQDLPAHADERAGKWPRKMLNDGMAPITQKLLEYRVQDRGTIAELLPKLEALARAHH
jgi:hypothetical protein